MPSRASSVPNAVMKPSRSASRPASRSAAPETRLICSIASGAWRDGLARPQQRGVEELVVVDDAVHEPDLQRLDGVDRLAEQVQLQRAWPGRPGAGAAGCRRSPGMMPRLISGWPKEALSAGDPEVAGHRDLAAAAEGEPVDRRDGHHRRALPLAAEALDLRQVLAPRRLVPLGERLDVRARAEQRRVGRREDHRPRAARHQLAPGRRQPRDRRRPERVRRRVRQPHDRDVVAQLQRRPARRSRPADTDRSPARLPCRAGPARPAAAGSPAARGARWSPPPPPAPPAASPARARRPARTAPPWPPGAAPGRCRARPRCPPRARGTPRRSAAAPRRPSTVKRSP